MLFLIAVRTRTGEPPAYPRINITPHGTGWLYPVEQITRIKRRETSSCTLEVWIQAAPNFGALDRTYRSVTHADAAMTPDGIDLIVMVALPFCMGGSNGMN
jgi:hypothetical protein